MTEIQEIAGSEDLVETLRQKVVSPEKEKFECDQCGRTFTYKAVYDRHMELHAVSPAALVPVKSWNVRSRPLRNGDETWYARVYFVGGLCFDYRLEGASSKTEARAAAEDLVARADAGEDIVSEKLEARRHRLGRKQDGRRARNMSAAELENKIIDFVRAHPGVTPHAINQAVGSSHRRVREMLENLGGQGIMSSEKFGRSVEWFVSNGSVAPLNKPVQTKYSRPEVARFLLRCIDEAMVNEPDLAIQQFLNDVASDR